MLMNRHHSLNVEEKVACFLFNNKFRKCLQHGDWGRINIGCDVVISQNGSG
jgi:hypothetical protein